MNFYEAGYKTECLVRQLLSVGLISPYYLLNYSYD